MSVSTEAQEFIYTSLAENNKSLLDQISKLIADSAESIKRFSRAEKGRAVKRAVRSWAKV